MKKIFVWLYILGFTFGNSFSQKSTSIHETMGKIETSYATGNTKEMLKQVHKLYVTDTILPDLAAYYLGYVLYKNEQYRASKVALLRYVQLTKEQGEAFDSTQIIINKIDNILGQYDPNSCDICQTLGPLPEKDTCPTCHAQGKHEQQCRACNGSGIEVCPRCLGIGYETYQDSFQNNYYPCRVCHKAGTITCTNCNGTTKEIAMCVNCGGEGQVQRLRICPHRNLEGASIHLQVKPKKESFYR